MGNPKKQKAAAALPPGEHVDYGKEFRRCRVVRCPHCGPTGRGHGPYWKARWTDRDSRRCLYHGRHQARPPQPLRVRTLGRFAVWRDGCELPGPDLLGRQDHRLLAWLLTCPACELAPERVREEFWPKIDPSNAAHNLRSLRCRLNSWLGETGAYVTMERPANSSRQADMLVLRPAGGLSVAPTWHDAHFFADTADQALRGRDLAALEAALALYTGPYLPGCRDAWAAAAREKLLARHTDIRLTLAQAAVTDGQPDVAMRHLREALNADPTSEAAAAPLLDLLLARGRDLEARGVYERLIKSLKSGLRIGPSRTIEDLMAPLLRERDAIANDVDSVPLVALPPTNLPDEPAVLFGVDSTLALLQDEWRGRVLTLHGAVGVGKSCLALELARRLRESRAPDGVWLANLMAISRTSAVSPAALRAVWEVIARAIGLRENGGSSLEAQVLGVLAARQDLLVLDNCEHVRGACAVVVQRLLSECPRLRVVVTSQYALDLPEELVWPVSTLPVPEGAVGTPEALAECPSAALFVWYARQADRRFALTRENAPVVARVCRALDGHPLALTLAAGTLHTGSLKQVAAWCAQAPLPLTRFRRPAGIARARHGTLASAIHQARLLLGQPARILLARLAVFRGAWTEADAAAVCGGGDLAADQIPATLARLVDANLALVVAQEPTARYRLLTVIRDDAWCQLADWGEIDLVSAIHLRWRLAWATTAVAALHGADQAPAQQALVSAGEDLAAALAWGLDRPEARVAAIELTIALTPFWERVGQLNEAARRLSVAESHRAALPPALQAALDLAVGRLSLRARKMWRAERSLRRAAERFAELGDDLREGWAQLALGDLYAGHGWLPEARDAYAQAETRFASQGERRGRALCLLGQARCDAATSPDVGMGRGALSEDERKRWVEGLNALQELGDSWNSARAFLTFGLRYRQGAQRAAGEADSHGIVMADRCWVTAYELAIACLDHATAARSLAFQWRLAADYGNQPDKQALQTRFLALCEERGPGIEEEQVRDQGFIYLRTGRARQAAAAFALSLRRINPRQDPDGVAKGVLGLCLALEGWLADAELKRATSGLGSWATRDEGLLPVPEMAALRALHHRLLEAGISDQAPSEGTEVPDTMIELRRYALDLATSAEVDV